MQPRFKKERFQPDLTDLGMGIQQAYTELLENQRKISVAVQKVIPKNINYMNNFLSGNTGDISNDISHNNVVDKEAFIKLNNEIKNLVESKAARIVAVHRVITNKGYRSKGLSEDHPKTNEEYVKLVEWLRQTMRNPESYRTTPLDRIYIGKKVKDVNLKSFDQPNQIKGDTFSKESSLRPISIPSIKDRCLQAVYYIGYSLYSEHVADDHSYAFRPGRSPAWAAQSVASHLRFSFKPNWIVEIDISKCFDSISHEFIIQNTPFIPKTIMRAWLKQGYILRDFEELGLFPTNLGIPQGGIISPNICNTVLDGADSYIRDILISEIKKGNINKSMAGYSIHTKDLTDCRLFILFRYADDIVIMTKSKYMAEKCRELLAQFLQPRNLQLSDKKTKITDVSGVTAEFTFVGYTFKKAFSQAANKSKWYIQPTIANIKRIKTTLSKICHKKSSYKSLFYDFNLALRSWCGYYATANAKHDFNQLNKWVFEVFYFALYRRVKRDKSIRIQRQKRKSGGIVKKKKIDKKYIYRTINTHFLIKLPYLGNRNMKWYSIRNEGNQGRRKRRFFLFSPILFKLIDQEHNKLTKMGLNYYNKDDYVQIMEINLNYKYGVHKRVLKKNFKSFGELTCTCCRKPFRMAGRYEFHHVQPLEFGGDNTDKNIIPICKTCHIDITSAVNKRSLIHVRYYMENNLLKIPENRIDEFH